MKAYKIATHRHTSEIEQELSLLAGENITLSFTPHLIPMKRGIFVTEYANLKKPYKKEELLEMVYMIDADECTEVALSSPTTTYVRPKTKEFVQQFDKGGIIEILKEIKEQFPEEYNTFINEKED